MPGSSRSTTADIDWFDLSLGIEVDGEKIPLLPVLLDLFDRAAEEMTPATLDAHGDEPVYGTLPDGRLLADPAPRASRPCSRRSYELFASRRIATTGPVRLSRAEATRLTALDAALPPGTVEWVGGERLRREMAHRLATTAEIPPVAPPAGLKATLRPYQEEGLAWLRFLGSCGSRASSPTTWASARRCRRSRTS